MKFEIVQMEGLSGRAAKIYSIQLEGDGMPLLEHFVNDNQEHYSDVVAIIRSLSQMGHVKGCKAHYFKDKEGAPGDGMVAFRYKQLRLYCLRYDNTCIFIGSGGYKPPGIAAYQEVAELNKIAQQMRRICASINKAIIEKDLKVKYDGTLEMTNYIDLRI